MSTIARFVVSRSATDDPDGQNFWSNNRYATLDKATLFRDAGEAIRCCDEGDVVMRVEVTLTAIDPHAHLTADQRERLVAMLAGTIATDRAYDKTTEESIAIMRAAGFGDAVITEAHALWMSSRKAAT